MRKGLRLLGIAAFFACLTLARIQAVEPLTKSRAKSHIGLRYKAGPDANDPIPGAPEVKPIGGWLVGSSTGSLSITQVERQDSGMLWLQKHINQTEREVMDVLELDKTEFHMAMPCGLKGSDEHRPTGFVAVVKKLDAEGCKLEAIRAWTITTTRGQFETTDPTKLQCTPECCGDGCN
ncbi:MAG: hypothetical protein ACT4O3_08970 [Elusimicrobiota bacterium]